MIRIRLILVSLFVLIVSPVPARAAGEAAGSAAASYLSIGSGASVLSMAGATLASGRDLAAAAWNPASLAQVDALQFSLSHTPLPGGATQDWLATGGRLAGGTTRWGLNALFHQETGIEGRDALNQPTGTLGVSSLALGANLARSLGPHASAGFGAQWLHESLAGSNGAGVAFDAGLRAQAGAIGFGLAARHMGGAMRYGDTSYELPAVVAVGASWSDEALGLRMNADFESPSHYYRAVRVGGEWTWRERLALRAGYRHDLGAPALEALSGATFGLGTGVMGAWLDYAFSPEGGDGLGQHRMGVTFRPGMSGVPRNVGADARSHKLVPSLEPATPAAKPVKSRPRPQAQVQEGSSSPRVAPTVAKPSATPTATFAAPSSPVVPVPPTAAASDPPATKAAEPAPSAPLSTPAASVSSPVAPVARPTSVVVVEGETMAKIASRWGTTVAALMMTNNLVSDRVHPGQKLRLPAVRRR